MSATVPTPGGSLAITENQIQTLVRTFYVRVRDDPELGPIFETAISDWDAHLDTMVDFWSSVMLTTGRYKGQPVRTHRTLTGVLPRHFETWLVLFRDSAEAVLPAETAALFVDRAERIAASLRLALFRRATRGAEPSPTAQPESNG